MSGRTSNHGERGQNFARGTFFVKPDKEELEDALEHLDYDIEHCGGWTIPPGQNAAVLATNGHLTLVHTQSLIELRDLIQRIQIP